MNQTLTVRLPAPLRAAIEKRAAAAGVSTSDAARALLRRAVSAEDLDRRIERALRRVIDQPPKGQR